MPTTSQFTRYTSNDPGTPPINGLSGSLIPVLDYCLVSGSGWIKSFSSASAAGVEVFAGYQMPSGSRCHLFVNDAGGLPAVQGYTAWFSGWEQLTGMGSPAGGNTTGSVGGGDGQFPTSAQGVAGGFVYCKKSSAATAASVAYWQLYADAYTMYIFITTGDVTATTGYYSAWFGDIYSFMGSTDRYPCMIHGRLSAGSGGGRLNDTTDMICTTTVSVANSPGMYMARSFGGIQGGITVNKFGDISKTFGSATSLPVAMSGQMMTPNTADGGYYIAPLRVFEHANLAIRGRVRGMWHLCHPVENFADGQIISGSNSQLGKMFRVISPSGGSAGHYLIEISNTVETN